VDGEEQCRRQDQFYASRAVMPVSDDSWQCRSEDRNCVYMLSISHVEMDDDDEIFLISTSRLRNFLKLTKLFSLNCKRYIGMQIAINR